jgi:3-deoxy-D-manno-octulosonic-acid transferase
VPVSLVNARLSARSAERWRRFAPALARRLLGGLRLVLPRSAEDAARLAALGAGRLAPPADLKLAAAPLPADESALRKLRQAVGARPVLLAASTHPGEDEQVMEAHRRIGLPGLLSILAPRHPQRGEALAALSGGGRLSQGELPDARPFFVADTIGDLGLLYRVAGVAFIGGSLVPHGGQNPLEAARLLCPALIGTHRANFSELSEALIAAGALRAVIDAEALARAASAVLTDAGAAGAMRRAARGFTEAASHIPGRWAGALIATLPRAGEPGTGTGTGR